MKPSNSISQLIGIMNQLRDPINGCPWDIRQNFTSILPYTLEEAYEVADAIERNDMTDLCDELGDLLLQVVFHAQMAKEEGYFEFENVVEAINSKMIRRHPHVFERCGENNELSPKDVKNQWDDIKKQEKIDRDIKRKKLGLPDEPTSILSSVSRSQPALEEALELQKKAATVGFDWSEAEPILDKVEEEISELRIALKSGNEKHVADELGDVIFSIANLGRHVNIQPEIALRGTNTKFRNRFSYIEVELAANNKDLVETSLAELETLWNQAKANHI